jgi:act minimal PKS acyl carrier protein
VTELTAELLMRTLRECAGEQEAAPTGINPLDVSFEELGYDSIALLETASRLGRELDLTIPDDVVFEAHTPRGLIEIINDQRGEA